MNDIHDKLMLALNKLSKWRMVFAGWQLGTRAKTDPEAQAVRDMVERSLIMRAEVTAISRILWSKGLCTLIELHEVIAEEAEALDKMLEKKFPGFTSTQKGMVTDERVAETTKGWRP
jgi:hypothetical protein